MTKYELVVVLSSKIEDEERAAAMEKVKGYVSAAGGTISDIDEWGKRRLAYEIQKMKEGYYSFVHFEGPESAPAELDSELRVMEPVIRFLCVKANAQ